MKPSGPRKYGPVFLLGALMVLGGIWPSGVTAQPQRQSPGVITGAVHDADSHAPVSFTQVVLEELNRGTTSDANGRFELAGIPAGTYTLKAFRIGYEQIARRITVPSGDTVRVDIDMTSSAVSADGVVVEGDRDSGTLADPALSVEGRDLRQHLGTTIAETLNDQPGIAMRSMGPAPARPVLRGLGGERLLVLEDGGRTGDLSAVSSDHAVVIEPMTAERIEIIRGPAALVYGSNTLGGVVNVVRGSVPSVRPDGLHAGMSVQGQSVNEGLSGGLMLTAPVGPLSVSMDGSIRQAGDLQTPAGKLGNTALSTYNASAGVSRIGQRGYIGGAGGYYYSEYGIPGGFVGAHPNGVDIRIDRKHAELRGEYLPRAAWLQRVEGRTQFSRYFHQEFESRDVVGVEYGILSGQASVVGYTAGLGPFTKGAVGMWGELRSVASGGLSFTPNAAEQTVAAFAFQEATVGAVSIQGGLRFDYRAVTPEHEKESRRVGFIRQRTFSGVSASLAGTWRPSRQVTAGLTLMRSLRMPGVEELYSEGPHLASYSFEVGNADLDSERGWGVEATARYAGTRASASLALFGNYIQDYIHPQNTGDTTYSVLLPIYQFRGATATMIGGEASASVPIGFGFGVEGSASYVRGTFTDSGDPLPFMPPLTGRTGLRYRNGPITLGLAARAATAQERLGAFEERTDGYVVFDAFGQFYLSTGNLLHTFDLTIENLTNAEYHDHLSRVKVIMPEPGLNLRLLYKVYF